ncbi:cytochrome c biogenesis protein [Luteolibacter algae]|uniref:Cytochrome c biogenesis protein n=1 Tax=Luteolibacter algae TaxID=454151 RepID=A0ABW5DAV6_9BACT
MKRNQSRIGRWIVAVLALGALGVVFANLLIDNMPKGEVQKVKGYSPWETETVEVMESLPLQDGGRIKPFSTYAGFKMLGLHGARSMKIEGENGEIFKIKPTEWLMDSLFRPELAIDMPTFRVDNSKVLEAIDVKVKGRRDRYSYSEIEPGRDKLIELAKSYEPIEKNDRDPVQQQTIDLAYNFRNYESLLAYFGFARSGITLHGSGGKAGEDRRADFSAVMTTAPQLRNEISRTQQEGRNIDERLQLLLQQVLDGANFSKFGLFILPPKSSTDEDWLSAGNAIMSVMTMESKDPELAIDDIKSLETAVRSVASGEKEFRKHLNEFKDRVEKRAQSRGELKHIDTEVSYFKKDYFLNALIFFLIGAICALAMWAFGQTKAGKAFSWVTLGFSAIGAGYCVTAIVIRCMIMQRPPVGNLYDTVIFIATAGVIFSLLVEWMTRRRFALGLAPILGTALIILARRYEVGDAGDHMDPLVAVLDSNFWLATHVITISLGYSAGLLAAMLSCGYVLVRGLNLDGENKDFRRALTKAVYGCICLTVFLSLVGTVLGGIWANYSWGRFWGWDPKENGALMIVLWTLAILHARLGGLIKDWGLHLASLFTACVVAFSWWHVNFLGVGLHNYGFTAGKGTIWLFYATMLVFIIFGAIAMLVEKARKAGSASAGDAEQVKALEA